MEFSLKLPNGERNMKIVNLTRKFFRVVDGGGWEMEAIPPSGVIAKILDNGTVTNLPPFGNDLLIVTKDVARACPERTDLHAWGESWEME